MEEGELAETGGSCRITRREREHAPEDPIGVRLPAEPQQRDPERIELRGIAGVAGGVVHGKAQRQLGLLIGGIGAQPFRARVSGGREQQDGAQRRRARRRHSSATDARRPQRV